MRISLVGPIYPFRGGIAQHTALLARALQQAGHTVDVFSFKRQYPAWLYPGQSDREPDENPDPFPASYLLDPLKPWTWQQAARQVAASRPDLALVVWWTTFWSPAYTCLAFLLKRARVKVAFLIHNVLPHEERFYDPVLARLALRQGQGFVVHMEAERRRLLDLVPAAGPIAVAPLPLFDQFLEYRLPKAEARQRLGLVEGEPVVLFFGIVRPYKGLRYLVEAMALLAQEGIQARLVVAGEYWEDIELYQQQLARLCLQERATLINHYLDNHEVGLYFSAADIFAAPYTGGTQSAAVKTALAFGLPVVMTDRLADEMMAGLPGQVQSVPARDAGALAGAIQKLIERGESGGPEANSMPPKAGWDEIVRQIERIAVPPVPASPKAAAA